MEKNLFVYGMVFGALMAGVMVAGNASIVYAQTSSGASGAGAAGSAAVTTNKSAVNVTGSAGGTLNPVGIANTATGATSATGNLTGAVSGAMVPGAPVTVNTSSAVGTWNDESNYWRNQYTSRPYYNSTTSFSSYEPAYQYGFNTYNQNPNKRYDELDQLQLRSQWEANRGTSTLTWDQAQAASRDAYERMYQNRVDSSATVH